MQCLCHLDAQGEESLPLLGRLLEGHDLRGEEAVQAERLARSVWREHEALDARIESASRNWSLGRMSPVDRSIIRLGAYELLHGAGGVPRAVVIDEAIRLAKEFGTAESASFVNGVLDALRPEEGTATDAAAAAGAPGEKE